MFIFVKLVIFRLYSIFRYFSFLCKCQRDATKMGNYTTEKEEKYTTVVQYFTLTVQRRHYFILLGY